MADRVAIVEDDAPVRRALVRVLGAARFQVTAFGSAEEFLDGGLEPRPDCVLMDIHLPLMNGLELRSRMAALEPDINVVFITADHELASGEHREPRSIWLTKPVDEDTLLEAVERACAAGGVVSALRQ